MTHVAVDGVFFVSVGVDRPVDVVGSIAKSKGCVVCTAAVAWHGPISSKKLMNSILIQIS